MGFVNLNVLPEFSRELRELPWQPKLGKNKPKLRKFQFLAINLEIFLKNKPQVAVYNKKLSYRRETALHPV